MTNTMNLNPAVEDLAALVNKEGYESGDRLHPIHELSRFLKSSLNLVRDRMLSAFQEMRIR